MYLKSTVAAAARRNTAALLQNAAEDIQAVSIRFEWYKAPETLY